MSVLNQSILSTAQSLPEGGILSPKEFLHLGSRAAVDQAFSRLSKEGTVVRIGRGMYVSPIKGRFGKRLPSTEAIVRKIEATSGEPVVSNGAASANALGLTTQVPVQEIFLTSGRQRTLNLGSRPVHLKHAPRWQTILGNRPAGQAIRAMAWLGPEHIRSTVKLLELQLPTTEWQALHGVRAQLPSWLAQAVSEVGCDA